jgi:hypothetical protein
MRNVWPLTADSQPHLFVMFLISTNKAVATEQRRYNRALYERQKGNILPITQTTVSEVSA